MNIVPTDSPSIYDALNNPDQATVRYALVRPDNPPPGIAGFIFSVVDDDTVELESDITTHYTEANNPVQDHIALHPETVMVTGDVAELILAVPTTNQVNQQANPLPPIPAMVPVLSEEAEANELAELESINKTSQQSAEGQSLFDYYDRRTGAGVSKSKQAVAFGYLYQLWKGRQLFSVETPWGFFTNMAIKSVSAHQGPTTRFVSDFTVTFEKIRTVKTVTINAGLLAGRAVWQQAPETQSGVVGLLPTTPAQDGQFKQQVGNPSP